MNFISLLNIVAASVFLVSIALVIFVLITRRIKRHVSLYLLLFLAIIISVCISNVLEHSGLSNFFDAYEEYLEILLVPCFLLFIYSITAQNEINQRKQKEERLNLALKEREVLLKEVHHRIKNNLQTIASLLSIQKNKTDDPVAKELFSNMANRVVAMGVLYKKLYKSEDFTHIDLKGYFTDIIDILRSFYKDAADNIQVKINGETLFVNIDTAIPCGLIVTEVVTNSFKYAFLGRSEGIINIDLEPAGENHFTVVIGDNGIGIPAENELNGNSGMGLKIIQLLTRQLHGSVELTRDGGTNYKFNLSKDINEEEPF